jgi:uncharacterized protein YggE
MKKWWLTGAAVGTLALLAGVLLPLTRPAARAADGDDKKAERRITTTGTGTVKVKPDAVHCSFGVRSKGGTFKAAQEENEAKVKKISEALTALKINGLQVRVAPMDVQVQTDAGNFPFPGGGGPGGGPMGPGPGPGGLPGPGGPPGKPAETATYNVTHSFTVTAREKDVEKLVGLADKVLSTAVTNGANAAAVFPYNPMGGIGGIQPVSGTKVEFFKEDETELRRQALTQAVTAALANAKAVAGGANLTVRDVVTLTDQPANSPFFGGFGSPARSDITGEYDVTVNVSVTYSY